MVPAQSVFANLIGARVEVRDDDSGVVATFAADDLAASDGIDSPEPNLECQPAVDPARLQIREILDRQIRSDDSDAASGNRVSERISWKRWTISDFTSRGREVYTSVGRIQSSPLRVDGSRATRPFAFWG